MNQTTLDRAHAEHDPIPLSSDPATVEVVAGLRSIRFPETCLKCGDVTDRSLPVTKLFRRRGHRSRPAYYVVRVLEAPFCMACVRTHEEELQPLPADVRRRLLLRWAFGALPFLFPLGVLLCLLATVVPDFAGDVPEDAGIWSVLLGPAIFLFFGGLAALFAFMIWKGGRRLILDPDDPWQPRYLQVESGPFGSRFFVPVEPTSTLRAFDYSDNRAELFDAERHLYTFESHAVAARFSELNAERHWNPEAPTARIAKVARWAVIAAILIGGLYLIVRDLLELHGGAPVTPLLSACRSFVDTL